MHSRDALRRLAMDSILEGEDLRAHIARALHDDLGQAMTVLNLHLYWLSRHCPGDASIREKLDEMQRAVTCANQTVQRLARDCRPVTVSAETGPADIFKHVVSHHRHRHGLDCEIAIADHLPELPYDYLVILSRMLHRILAALAQRDSVGVLRITLAGADDSIMLRMQSIDAGVRESDTTTLRPAATRAIAGWIAALGGSFQAVDGSGGCEEVRIALPLPTG